MLDFSQSSVGSRGVNMKKNSDKNKQAKSKPTNQPANPNQTHININPDCTELNGKIPIKLDEIRIPQEPCMLVTLQDASQHCTLLWSSLPCD